jgi:hypothetical protein
MYIFSFPTDRPTRKLGGQCQTCVETFIRGGWVVDALSLEVDIGRLTTENARETPEAHPLRPCIEEEAPSDHRRQLRGRRWYEIDVLEVGGSGWVGDPTRYVEL